MPLATSRFSTPKSGVRPFFMAQSAMFSTFGGPGPGFGGSFIGGGGGGPFGMVKPSLPFDVKSEYDLIVIGGGSGG